MSAAAFAGVAVVVALAVSKARLGADTKPLLSDSTTGEFNLTPQYLRTMKKCRRRESSVKPLRCHVTLYHGTIPN